MSEKVQVTANFGIQSWNQKDLKANEDLMTKILFCPMQESRLLLKPPGDLSRLVKYHPFTVNHAPICPASPPKTEVGTYTDLCS